MRAQLRAWVAREASSAINRPLVVIGRANHRRWLSTPATAATTRLTTKRSLDRVPTLQQFMQEQAQPTGGADSRCATEDEYVAPSNTPRTNTAQAEALTVYIETYGCQMNESDTEIIRAILDKAGYLHCPDAETADIILTNTCAIREGAESKVWQRLGYFKNLKRKRGKSEQRPVVGVLGCMAERLKTKLLESDKMVDIVAGPDSYRDLPRLIELIRGKVDSHAVNVQLSQDETYADIAPVRSSEHKLTAYVSIMRGCNNMCSFCIVPFTRGRERSRLVTTIVDEIKRLEEDGYREVTLLGQNVNSYHDKEGVSIAGYSTSQYAAAPGFTNMFKSRDGEGIRFTELLDQVSQATSNIRLRFTSPHPKDFPVELLQLMAERPNICKQVHLPAQSGSSTVLDRMRRGYTREAYLDLAARIREMIPGVSISSDFITGFCGETEQDHADTLSLIREVRYEQAFMFAYSRRERTHAAYNLVDDVPPEVKQRRLVEVISTFRSQAALRNESELGKYHLVMLEGQGFSKKQDSATPTLVGRSSNNKRCVFPPIPLPASVQHARDDASLRLPVPGDWVLVQVTETGISALQSTPIAFSSIAGFAADAAAAAAVAAYNNGAALPVSAGKQMLC